VLEFVVQQLQDCPISRQKAGELLVNSVLQRTAWMFGTAAQRDLRGGIFPQKSEMALTLGEGCDVKGDGNTDSGE
jgi:hypothetical protein